MCYAVEVWKLITWCERSAGSPSRFSLGCCAVGGLSRRVTVSLCESFKDCLGIFNPINFVALSFCFCRRSCREVRRSRSHRKSRSHFIGHRQGHHTRDRRTNRPLSDVHPPPTIGLAVRTSSPASYPSKRAHGIVPPHRHHQGCVSSPPSRLSSTKAFAKVRCGARAQKHRAPAHSRVLAWQVIVEKLQLEIQRKHVPQEKEQGIPIGQDRAYEIIMSSGDAGRP